MNTFSTIEQIKAANREAGYHDWDKDAVRFFEAVTYDTLYGGRYFVERITVPPEGGQAFQVKAACWNGRVCTVAEGIPSLELAQERAALFADPKGWSPIKDSGYRERAWALLLSRPAPPPGRGHAMENALIAGRARMNNLLHAEYNSSFDMIRFGDGSHLRVVLEGEAVYRAIILSGWEGDDAEKVLYALEQGDDLSRFTHVFERAEAFAMAVRR